MHDEERSIPHPVHHALLGQADNPRRLVPDDGGCTGSCSFPYPTELDGIPGRVPGDHRLGPLQGLRVSRYPGAYASPLHRRGGNCTRTGVKLSQAAPVQPIPGCVYSRFWLTNRTDLVGDRREGVVPQPLLKGVEQRLAVRCRVEVLVRAAGGGGQMLDAEAVLALGDGGEDVLGPLVPAGTPATPDGTRSQGGEGGGELHDVLAALGEADVPFPRQRDRL